MSSPCTMARSLSWHSEPGSRPTSSRPPQVHLTRVCHQIFTSACRSSISSSSQPFCVFWISQCGLDLCSEERVQKSSKLYYSLKLFGGVDACNRQHQWRLHSGRPPKAKGIRCVFAPSLMRKDLEVVSLTAQTCARQKLRTCKGLQCRRGHCACMHACANVLAVTIRGPF
jgi:hypothetical protein